MARSLTFDFEGTAFDAKLIKVDRNKLYGSVRVITNDADDRRCTVATLASDGNTLIPRGGTALGYVNTEGNWIDRGELQPVSLSGEPLTEVESSFDAPVPLQEEVDAQTLLDHSVRLTYQLGVEKGLPDSLQVALEKGKIYRFGFSYRGGVGYDSAFILSDAQSTIWMLITEANEVEYVSLEQAALCAGEPIADEIGNEDDSLDFGML
ncbi:MAG: hypothetical protein AB8B79_06135 [Granulosicoccus sp.]